MIIVRGNRSTRREELSQFHFVHYKSHMTWTGLEPGPPATNNLSYGTATVHPYYIPNYTLPCGGMKPRLQQSQHHAYFIDKATPLTGREGP
jgi:hypothetical protein